MGQQNMTFLNKQLAWQSTPEYLEVAQAEKVQAELQKTLEAVKAAEEAAKAEREAREKRAATRKRAKEAQAAKDVTPAAKRRRGSAVTPDAKGSMKTSTAGKASAQ